MSKGTSTPQATAPPELREGKALKMIVSAVVKVIVGTNVLATVGIFALTMYVVIDVLGRALFHLPVPGTPELAKMSIVAITFLQIPYVLMKDRHIRTTFILERLGPKWRSVFEIVAAQIGVAVFVMIFYGGWDLMISSFVTNEFEGEGALRVPAQPNRIIVQLGSALMVLVFAAKIFNHLKMLFNGEKEQ